jgi:DNA replication protein DnaC
MHPSTRVAVLEHIMSWILDLQKICFFMWLYGPAGAGKSAIAQSIAATRQTF